MSSAPITPVLKLDSEGDIGRLVIINSKRKDERMTGYGSEKKRAHSMFWLKCRSEAWAGLTQGAIRGMAEERSLGQSDGNLLGTYLTLPGR